MSAVIRFDRSKLPHFVSQIVDLQAKLAIEPSQFWDILDSLPVAVMFSSDRECRLIEGNATARMLLRAQPGQNLSKSALEQEQPPFEVYANGRPVPASELPMQKAALTGKPVPRSECELRFKDGSRVFLSGHSVPILDRNGEVCGSIGAFTDVTHVVLLEEQNRINIEANKHKELALRESEQRFQRFAESLPQLVWTCNSEGLCDYLGPQWFHYTGASEAEQLGYGWLNQLHPSDRERTITAWNEAAATGENFVAEFRIRRRDGAYRWFRTLAVPIRDDADNIIKWFGSNTEIDDLKQTEAKLRESEALLSESIQKLAQSEARYRWALKAGQLVHWETDLAAGTRTWTQEAMALFGLSLVDGRGHFGGDKDEFWLAMHPDDRHLAKEFYELADKQDWFPVEYRIRRSDGTIRWVSGGGQVIARNADGKAQRLINVVADVTQRKAAEEQIKFLMSEITHRSKNLLSVVQGIASQTGRSVDTFEQFRMRFAQRLQGLAASHDLLVRDDWQGVSLFDLLRDQLSPFVEFGSDRIAVSGPDIILSPKATEAIGMALHELATNAVKYGALSVPSGHISISWVLEDQDAKPRQLLVRWVERDGPPVKPPSRKGFGQVVFERLVAESLGGVVALDFAPEGLRWALSIPTNHIVADPLVAPNRSADQIVDDVPSP